ncbi:MAG: ADOP family duplicated permease [Longimicrobiales bacterium]
MIRPGVREYFRLRPDLERLAAQVDEEIAFHLEQRAQGLMRCGMEPAAARAEAERRFGAIERANLILLRGATRRETRMSVREWMLEWRTDLSYAARSLMRDPLVALVVVVTLALGIGANAMMFGIIDQLLLRGPAHVVKPNGIGRVYIAQKAFMGEKLSPATGYVTYAIMRDNTRSFSGVAAYNENSVKLGKGEDARDVPVGYATWDMFPLLGVRPALGRFFTAEEDHPPVGDHVAVLDYEMWQKEYGGERSVIGRQLDLGEKGFTIIGVAPKGFTGPELRPVSVWMPMSVPQRGEDWPTSWCCSWLSVIARTKPGVTPEVASFDATRAYRAAATEAKSKRGMSGTISVLPLAYGYDGKEKAESAVTRWLVGVAFIVLMIACANVINLLLARSVRRRREVSIRLAMGISRARLVRLLLSESILLALAGGIAALAVTYWGGKFIQATLLPDIQWDAPVNARVLFFAAAVTIGVGIVVGLVPALQGAKLDLTSTLKAGTRQGGGQRRSSLRDSLTVLQAALSLVLLVGAGLFVRSLIQIDRLDLGIDANKVLTIEASLAPDPKAPDDWEAASKREDAFNKIAIERLKSRSDVAAIALAMGTPLTNSFGVTLIIPGYDSLPDLPGGGPFIVQAAPEYFSTVGTQLLRGRLFNNRDGPGGTQAVIVNAAMAKAVWAGGDPLTKCLIIGQVDAACTPVVGVVEDVHRSGLREEPSMQYYVPFGQVDGICCGGLLIRPKGDQAAFAETLRHELFAIAPDAKGFRVELLSKRLDPEIRPWKLGATLFIAFGVLALVIAGIGLFSVIAYSVTQRRAELGIRLALGARSNTIIGLILRQGVLLAGAGILLGILLSLLASGFIEPLLFDTNARDVTTILAVAAILMATTVAACLLPALRAGRVNPLEALRAD